MPPKEVMTDQPLNGEKVSRKLCPWPQTARYVKGDVNDWTSHVCGGEMSKRTSMRILGVTGVGAAALAGGMWYWFS